MRLVYIAGPYRAGTRWEEEMNCRAAELLGREVVKLGAYPVIPHSNTRPYFSDEQSDAFWLEGTMLLMHRCDAVLLVENWHMSDGANAERSEAMRIGMPVFTLDGLADWLQRDGFLR